MLLAVRGHAVPLLLAAVVAGACSGSLSTAHIASVQIGASEGFTSPLSTFGPTDTVYARGDAGNLPNAVTINWQVFAENVAGQAPNTHISQLDKSFNVTADSTVSLTLSPPTAGWPTGLYKVVATMVDGSTQRDQKSAEFTVSDSGAPASSYRVMPSLT